MGIQTITGVVQNAEAAAWANSVIEVAFSDGYVPLSPLNIVGRTDTNGKFRVPVYNNATEVEPAVLRLPDDSLFSFDLDPEDTTVDLGTLIASGVAGQPRLMAVADGIRRYKAIMAQSGTGAPTETFVIENTLVNNVEWARISPGTYRVTSIGAFPAGRTFAVINFTGAFVGDSHLMTIKAEDDDYCDLLCKQINFNSPGLELIDVDESFGVEIVVYP